MEEALAYLLDVRLRCRGDREATALVDRCLSLLARAEAADEEGRRVINAEIESARSELAERFGPFANRHH